MDLHVWYTVYNREYHVAYFLSGFPYGIETYTGELTGINLSRFWKIMTAPQSFYPLKTS